MMSRLGGNTVGNGVNGENSRQSSNGLNKWALFGLGGALGLSGGIGLGIHLGKKQALKRAKEALKTVRKEAYENGWDEGWDAATENANEFIAQNSIMVDGNTPEEVAENALKMLQEKAEAKKQEKAEEEKAEKEEAKEFLEGSLFKPVKNEESAIRKLTSDSADLDREYKANKVRWLYSRGIKNFDIARVTGYPESFVRSITKDLGVPGDVVETDEDIDNYDLSIDEEDEEAREMTEARERYLDELERYIGNPDDGPHYISSDDFNEEAYLDKVYVDYFEVDNVFVSNDDASHELDDPVTDFGTADGKALFANNPHREDEDIVTMRNFKQNAVYEITRYHEAYASVRDGSAYLNGSTANV